MAEENFDEAVEMDKKAAKKAAKARKKEEKRRRKQEKKEAKENGADLEDGESTGGKVAVFFVTLLIILVWLAILAVLIRFDVGGFGSTVMQPLLKDVPYLNRILPETEAEEGKADKQDDKYPYKTLDEAIEYIKELEKQLSDAKESNSKDDAYVADLEAQAAQWKEYKENESKFEEEKAKFYSEVVFSDQAPDISEYKAYYESIDPKNAEALYKQVVEQEQNDAEIADYVKAYSEMKPKQAAAIFDAMINANDIQLVAKILEAMKADTRGDILGNMSTETAAKVTKLMEP